MSRSRTSRQVPCSSGASSSRTQRPRDSQDLHHHQRQDHSAFFRYSTKNLSRCACSTENWESLTRDTEEPSAGRSVAQLPTILWALPPVEATDIIQHAPRGTSWVRHELAVSPLLVEQDIIILVLQPILLVKAVAGSMGWLNGQDLSGPSNVHRGEVLNLPHLTGIVHRTRWMMTLNCIYDLQFVANRRVPGSIRAGTKIGCIQAAATTSFAPPAAG